MIKKDFNSVIGADIAKKKFDVACLLEGKFIHKVFTNDVVGFAGFVAWFLSLCGDASPLICMEATGSYSLPLADYLVNHGFPVSLVNPAKIHAFAKSELSHAKTDKADAKLIARYALMTQPPLWTQPPANIRELQALVRRVEHLLEMIQMEQNRLETADAGTHLSITNVLNTLEIELKSTRKAIQDHIDNNPDLKQRSDLLETIPGIGEVCIAPLLLALSAHHGFTHAKQVAAFAGLAPVLRESGQWRGNTHISKTGDTAWRKVLYRPALCAKRYNPVIQILWDRLHSNGKNGKAISVPLCVS
jgi:transposase